MEEREEKRVSFLHMGILAAISVLALVAVSAFQIRDALQGEGRNLSAKNAELPISTRAKTPFDGIDWQAPVANATSTEIDRPDEDGIANIGANVVSTLVDSYVALQENGEDSLERREGIAQDIGASLGATVSHKTYAEGDVKTDADTSYDRMLKYRNDLRIALEPLLKNPEYELKLFATYIETGNRANTDQLTAAAKNYRETAANVSRVVVPKDALSQHLAILNALSSFGATIDAMAVHADDPFAAAALLQTYAGSEKDLFTSFDALATYYRTKKS
ncbi:hypothetical protein HY478_03870 [Candidatus Uhrbacteria bacterium]|nr:hypothetical protein [Candidatus Uhrbacteria bacterium]